MRLRCTWILPLFIGSAAFADWPQDAHDAQRTGYTAEEPKAPWKFVWSWNGPDKEGGTGGHFYDAPREGRTIVGDGKIFVPAGKKGLIALDLVTGRKVWECSFATFEATPVYDAASKCVFASVKDDYVSGHCFFKLKARGGKMIGHYRTESPIQKSMLLADNAVFAVDASGKLYRINREETDAELTADWIYDAKSPAATCVAYSAKEKLLLFATEDLHVHAVDVATGERRWRVKPTPNKPGFPNSFAGAWPVVAEKTGVVFLRMRLDHDAGLWQAPGPKSIYPDTNAETREFLVKHPELQNLFALRLADGAAAFVPAVGYGGVEDLVKSGTSVLKGEPLPFEGAEGKLFGVERKPKPFLNVGPPPVVRTIDHEEVAYLFFRNGQGKPPDGRWDSHLGEMKLAADDDKEFVPGDLRFVEFPNSTTKVTDEQVPLTMAGETVFRAHWGASESTRIIDRSAERGKSFHDPIRSQAHPPVVRRQTKNANFDPETHWTTTGLTLFKDGRYWNGPGWWVYWNVLDPPTPERNAYSDGLRPRYTYVSDGYVIVQGNGGELFVLKHSGKE